MAESLELFAEIAAMRNQLEDVSAVTGALLRAGSDSFVADTLAYLTNNEAARLIFLQSNGTVSQAEIVANLRERGVPGGSPRGVSERLVVLTHDYHLLSLDHRTGNRKVYRKTEVARVLQIERKLAKAGLVP
jgi:hypothetical protein